MRLFGAALIFFVFAIIPLGHASSDAGGIDFGDCCSDSVSYGPEFSPVGGLLAFAGIFAIIFFIRRYFFK